MKKLLVVVDYQNDFVDGALGFEGAELIGKTIKEKIENYLNENNDVIFTLDTHTPDYMNTHEGKNLPVVHCVKNSEGWKVKEEVNYLNKAK